MADSKVLLTYLHAVPVLPQTAADSWWCAQEACYNLLVLEEAHVATGHSFPACSQAAVQAAALQIQQAAFQGQQQQQAQLDQVAALLRELQERLLVQQQLPARQFRSLEGKLGALEGSVLSAGGARLQHSPTLLSFRNARVCSLISISPPQQGTWSPS